MCQDHAFFYRNKKETDEITQYTTKFNIASFLKLIPKPIDFFSDPNRKPLLQSTANEEDNEQVTSDREYAFNVLCNLYLYHRVKTIKLILHSYNYDLIKTTDRLDRLPRALRNPRRTAKCETVCKNIPLLQEVGTFYLLIFFLSGIYYILNLNLLPCLKNTYIHVYFAACLFATQKTNKTGIEMEGRTIPESQKRSRTVWPVRKVPMLF